MRSPGGRSISDDRGAPAKFDAVEALQRVADDAGLSLTHMALGFVDTHPAVTATIIGPAPPALTRVRARGRAATPAAAARRASP